jgi:hypothetical protein
LASLARAGPVTSYPDVLVVRGGIFLKSQAAELMLAAGFREVDVRDVEVFDMLPRDVPRTLAIAPIAGCQEALEAWGKQRGAGFLSPGWDKVEPCLTVAKWDQQRPERSSAVVLLQREFTAFNRSGRRSLASGTPPFDDRELRIKDGSKDVLVDYQLAPSERPMFPLLVGGFEVSLRNP